jgi:hypothetical protein
MCQVLEVGESFVAPPDDVADFAAIEMGGAAWDCTAAVHRSQRASLVSAGVSCCAPEVHFAGSVHDHTGSVDTTRVSA